eukprot:1160760-Pelagomonas_calceolata.AAC.5
MASHPGYLVVSLGHATMISAAGSGVRRAGTNPVHVHVAHFEAALYSSHPWEALAVHWRCHASGNGNDDEEAGAAGAADADCDSAQEGEGGCKGGKTGGRKKGKDGLASMDAMLQLCGCGAGSMGSTGGHASVAGKAPAVAAAAVAAQAFVGGLVLGERVHQVGVGMA